MHTKWRKTALGALLTILLASLLAGCGGPKPDVEIFMMFDQASPFDKQEAVQGALQNKLGESMKVEVVISPISDPIKMVVELAGGEWGVYVLPKEAFETFKKEDGYVPLDDILAREDYPDGVHNGRLVGVPLKDSKLLKDAGYKGNEVYGIIIARAKNKEKAKMVLKAMAER